MRSVFLKLWMLLTVACSAPLGAAVASQQLDDGGGADVSDTVIDASSVTIDLTQAFDRFVVYGPSVGGTRSTAPMEPRGPTSTATVCPMS
jgi:hypothetical protein